MRIGWPSELHPGIRSRPPAASQRHFHLDDADRELAGTKRWDHMRLGFAVQLARSIPRRVPGRACRCPRRGRRPFGPAAWHLRCGLPDPIPHRRGRWLHSAEIKKRHGYREFAGPRSYHHGRRELRCSFGSIATVPPSSSRGVRPRCSASLPDDRWCRSTPRSSLPRRRAGHRFVRSSSTGRSTGARMISVWSARRKVAEPGDTCFGVETGCRSPGDAAADRPRTVLLLLVRAEAQGPACGHSDRWALGAFALSGIRRRSLRPSTRSRRPGSVPPAAVPPLSAPPPGRSCRRGSIRPARP